MDNSVKSLIETRSRFVIIDGTPYMEVEGPYDNYYAGIDLTVLEHVEVTGTPKDCQILVALHSSGLIHPDGGEDDEYYLSHWQLLEYHCIKDEEMISVPFSSDLQTEYLVLHGLESDLWLPLPLENVVDEEGNDIKGFDELQENVALSFTDDDVFPAIFMSESQKNENIRVVNKIVDASCDFLRSSGTNARNLNDLVLLYLKSNQ